MIEWTSIPFKVGGKKNIIAVGVPLLLWIIVFIFWGPGWCILSVLLVGASIFPYFTPTRYRLTEKEIKVSSIFTKQKKKWDNYSSFYVDKNGVLLSPFKEPSRLENFRGIYIHFHNNKEKVIAFIKKKMEQGE